MGEKNPSDMRNLPRRLATLGVMLTLLDMAVQGANIDYTSRLAGATCDDATLWTISGDVNGALQCDTWSSRGNKDGSNMTTPFMEYWVNQQTGPLGDATIRHQDVTGLPAGRYELTMHVRCYDESGATQPLSGVALYMNGNTVDVCSGDNVTVSAYNGQTFTNATLTVGCNLAEGETLHLGLNVSNANCNWVAWKDLRLVQVSSEQTLTTGVYYLRHKSTGLYVNAGHYGGTQAVLGTHPFAATLSMTDSETCMIDFGLSNEGLHHLAVSDNRVVMDGEPQTWTLAKATDGSYLLMSEGGSYLGYNSSDMTLTANSASASAANRWELLTRNQLVTALLNATATRPADATFLIANPRMDRNFAETTWEGDFTIGGEQGWWADYGTPGNYCAEVWNRNFNISQQLNNIPNGRYRLSVQGFYRYNDTSQNTNSVALDTYNSGNDQLYAELYANGSSSHIQSIASEHRNLEDLGLQGGDSGLPYSMSEASHAFSAGLYANNSVEVDVTNHRLTIGVRKTQQDGCDWTVWDNFSLTMLASGDNTGYDPNADPSSPEGYDYDSATPEHPLDLTALIKNADCSAASGWKGSPSIGGPYEDRNAEAYYKSFDVYQTLTGLPAGWYRVTAKGFYRYGDVKWEEQKSYYGGGWQENDVNNVYAMYTIPYATISHRLGLERPLAVLYANRRKAPLPMIFDYAVEQPAANRQGEYAETEFGWVPNTQTAAAWGFAERQDSVQLLVPVTDGKLQLGVKKSQGYKNDWAVWDDFHLYYLGQQDFSLVSDLQLSVSSLQMSAGEERQVDATLSPATGVADADLQWTSSNSTVATVDAQGRVVAKSPGTATITVTALGSLNASLVRQIPVSVAAANGDPSLLQFSEIQVSNLDMFLDPSYNYGGWVELYNPSAQSVSLNGLYLSLDAANLQQFRLTSANGYVPARGYKVIWFDHATGSNGQIDEKLDMDGGTVYLSSSNGTLLTSQAYPAGVSRTSFVNQGGTWGITATPTPGQGLVEGQEVLPLNGYARLPEPEVSQASTLFTSPFSVQVETPQGATLRYTTDGSTPTLENGQTSEDGRFDISQTTILRLRLFQQGLLPSAVKTCSYLYKDKDYMLPVLSVVSDPAHFYNDTIGVFVPGVNGVGGSGINYNCNWNQDWDRPAAYNFFTVDGDTCYSQEAALSRFGGWSRAWYPFNFKLNAQAQYEGKKFMEHPFFPLKKYNKHKVLQVRNGGNDLRCRIRDAALQQIILTSGLHLDCQDYRPVHSFINGQYQGMVNLREPSNKHFAYANYGIDTDLMDQMELHSGIDVKVGDDAAFQQWRQLSGSAADADTYRQICDLVDVEEFANYMATQLFLGGDDWPTNNCKAFKGDDGKFHLVLFDIDQALRFDGYAFTRIAGYRNCPLIAIFLNMLQNDVFRQMFNTSFSIVAGSVFDPQRSIAILNSIANEMEPALALEGASTEPTAGYMRNVLTATRRNTMMQALANWSYARISGNGQQTTLDTNVPEARLLINGLVVPTGHFDGTLYNHNVLQAAAPEGYTFKGWHEGATILSTEDTFCIDGMGNLQLTALFEKAATDHDMLADIATPIKVNEVSAGNEIYINDLLKKNDWIELYNTTDTPLDAAGLYLSDNIDQPLKYQIPASNGFFNTVIPAKGHLLVWADKLEPVTQLHANFKLSNNDQKMVLVVSSDQHVANNRQFYEQHPEMRSFVDAMTYNTHRGDQSVVRFPDGGRDFYQTDRPTIEAKNMRLSTDLPTGTDQNLMQLDPADFTLELAKGWNWTSHILLQPIAVGELSSHATSISGQTATAYLDPSRGWTGTLSSMDAGRMYKVFTTEADVYNNSQRPCDSWMPIALQPGWNWVGYPVNGSQTLEAAMSLSTPDEGDAIMGQDGFSTYENGRWCGTLSTLETGKGYVYRASTSRSLQFARPNFAVNLRKARARRNAEGQQYGYDRHAWPEQMGVVACLLADGEVVEDDRYTLLAYNGDVCCGVGQWVDQVVYITVGGFGGEDITYRVVDNVDQKTYAVQEETSFEADVLGSKAQPVVLNFDSSSDILTLLSDASGRSSASSGYYSLSGVWAGQNAASLPAGIYITRDGKGRHRKLYIR